MIFRLLARGTVRLLVVLGVLLVLWGLVGHALGGIGWHDAASLGVVVVLSAIAAGAFRVFSRRNPRR